MNTQKLKELLEQAGFDVERLLAPHPGGFPKDDFLVLESFAELIVDECRYVMDCNKGSDQHTEWNRALFETSEKIKQHFGVEE
jgi:hypothetical protein